MKKTKIFLIVLAVIIALVSALVWWQFGNIKSAYYFLKYDNENIEKMIDDRNEDVVKTIKKHGDYNVRPSTESEEKLHQEEIINDDELIGILTGKTSVSEMFGTDIKLDENKNFVDQSGAGISKDTLSENKTPPKPLEEKKDEGTAQSKEELEQRASECIAKMYVLKSNFESQLQNVFYTAREYYYSLSAEDKKNAKSILITKYYPQITALESKCDSDVAAVLTELDLILTKTNGDKIIVEKIRQAYDEEKSLKKAYYLNRLT